MKVVGLDLSIASTGVAVIQQQVTTHVEVSLIRTKAATPMHERLDTILGKMCEATAGADLITVEGPAYGAQGDAYHQLAGLWWLVTHELHRLGEPFVVVPPSNLKIYACGKGTAAKDEVIAAVVRRYPEVPVTNNNQADALVLAAMGARHLGYPIEQIPKANLRNWDKVPWPAAA